MLERDKAEDIGKSVFEKDANDFAIAGNVVIEVNRRAQGVEYHAGILSIAGAVQSKEFPMKVCIRPGADVAPVSTK